MKVRYQVVGSVGICALAAALALLPTAGLCRTEVREIYTPDHLTYCSFGDLNTSPCLTYAILFLLVGFALPVVATTLLYIYIYRLAARARVSHRELTETSASCSMLPEKQTRERAAARTRRTEEQQIPWSIVATLTLCACTTLPWGLVLLYSDALTLALVDDARFATVFDVFYAVLQIGVGVSPLLYIVTTRSLRLVMLELGRKVYGGCC